MCERFVHLHNHTEYSLLDGANRIPAMVRQAKEMGMEALAITDHGVMFGVMEFYFECEKEGIKPILGVEAYMAPGGIQKRTSREEKDSFHLLLLAKDLEGYRNLCKLSTIAALEGYYKRPRIDHEILKKHCKGLIGTSACLGSEMCQALLNGEYDKAQYTAGFYKELFGDGNFFIELQDHNLKAQAAIKEGLLRIAKELHLPLIATNDAHYLCKGDAKPHDVLLCIQTGAKLEDQDRWRFETDEFYLKSPEEMRRIFQDTPEALENTAMIAEICNVELGQQRAAMPDPELPEGETPLSYLRKMAEKGLGERIKNADERTYERLNYELDVIQKTGFESYFLLVREFAKYTRDQGIFFGVRGSAAGSLVSYCLGITDVDPLEYDLTFERFLNIERISMPDIDMDFEDARRDEIIKWVTQKYGKDHVAQIVTFGTLGAKAAIKDCGRVMGYSPAETDKICKTIPNQNKITIEDALKESAEFRRMVDSDPRVRQLIDVAKQVEGTARHCGVHAAGLVIAKDPLVEHVPLYRGTDGQPVTAYEMKILEKIGLLKMDFLGLSNLTVLARCTRSIRKTKGKDINVWELPLDDKDTYEMLGQGETVGVFQLESAGMRRHVIELKPQSVRELAAMVALYRPGPMEHIPRYLDYKWGRQKPVYLDPRMEPILKETFGIIVYQDQVLKIVQALAGFSLGKADILRRAMGKKDLKAMESMQKDFMAGTSENGISESVAKQVWELLLPFAGYAFNKAHAVCYAMIAYQTAYLKAHYPVEYFAALLSVYQSKEDRVVTFIEEARRHRIQVLRPCVNQSDIDFCIDGQSIRFGLAAIKGVGEGITDAIIKDRMKHGPYKHLYEFCERMKHYGLNRTALEALIKAGALECVDRNRRKLLQCVDAALAYAELANKDRLVGQDSLFGDGEASSSIPAYPVLPDCEPMTRTEVLSTEKEVMGIYLSDHPLRGMERLVNQSATHTCASVVDLNDGDAVQLAGVISGVKKIVTKSKGERMAVLTLEDFSGQAVVTVFPATYAGVANLLVKDSVVKISGVVMHRERRDQTERTIEVRLSEISPLEPVLDLNGTTNVAGGGVVEVEISKATESQIRDVKRIAEAHPGRFELCVQVLPRESHLPIYTAKCVDPSPKFVDALKACIKEAQVNVIGPDLGDSEDEDYVFGESSDTETGIMAS